MKAKTTTKSRPWHGQRASSVADALLFFVVFVIGVSGILWLKREGYDPKIVTALPCVLLIVYGILVKFLPRFRLREDQAGDNCYYLGFLFTLVSLVLALIAFVDDGGTAKVVENFGIALASTIVGLALRVAFNQMGDVPFDVEKTVADVADY